MNFYTFSFSFMLNISPLPVTNSLASEECSGKSIVNSLAHITFYHQFLLIITLWLTICNSFFSCFNKKNRVKSPRPKTINLSMNQFHPFHCRFSLILCQTITVRGYRLTLFPREEIIYCKQHAHRRLVDQCFKSFWVFKIR
jgi:uncharacterized membrane protein